MKQFTRVLLTLVGGATMFVAGTLHDVLSILSVTGIFILGYVLGIIGRDYGRKKK